MKKRNRFHMIDAHDARVLMQRDDVLVLDARDPQSFRKSHIDEAHRVDIANLSMILETAPKSMPIVIYCHKGYASQEFAKLFADFNFKEVYSLIGGYEEWLEQTATLSAIGAHMSMAMQSL
ncbi:hypothetical protein LPB41_21250 [Thalassospira sp. MA62]|nr:hypothetical protein [Thalassospira sp. MA62]